MAGGFNNISGVNIDGTLIRETLNGVSDFAMRIREMITGKVDPKVEAQLIKEAQDIQAKLEMAQVEVNKVEAASSSLFVAGWRPAIGWVGAISLGCYYVPQAIMATVVWVIACYNASAIVHYPTIFGWVELTNLIAGMLGLGWLRTQEKKAGVAR